MGAEERGRVDALMSRPMAVIGAGTLGPRIALMLATRGGEVRIFARTPERCQAAKTFVEQRIADVARRIPGGSPGRIVASETLASAVEEAGLVIESVPEKLALKQVLFGEMDRLAPVDAILASNSSSFPTSRMIDRVSRPERVANTHFTMPPERTVVEIMSCGRTDPAVIRTLMEMAPLVGLEPYLVRRESVGFIFNRIWAAIKRESLAVVAEGVSTPEEIDAIYSRMFGVAAGPFRLMDTVGLDVVLDIEENYADVREGIPQGPRDLLRDYIGRGRLGRKAGRGFYDYDGSSRGDPSPEPKDEA
jgi:3-hydroxybutyryl-CoA dehydrogenase